MAIVVVVGSALLCAASSVAAQDAAMRADGLFCSDSCDRGYEVCMRRRTGKGTVDCPGNLLRCRNDCDPNWASTAKAERKAEPVSCPERCQKNFDECTRADDGKHGAACAKDVMVCRDGCPPEPSAALPEPEPDAVPAPQAAPAHDTTPTHGAASTQEHAPARGAAGPRDDGVHATESTPPSVESVPSVRAAAPPPVVAPAPLGVRDEAIHPAASTREQTAPESTQDRAAPAEKRARPSAWARLRCVFATCDAVAANRPLSCRDACDQGYDTCIAHEDPKRGNDCAGKTLRCKLDCDRSGAHAAP